MLDAPGFEFGVICHPSREHASAYITYLGNARVVRARERAHPLAHARCVFPRTIMSTQASALRLRPSLPMSVPVPARVALAGLSSRALSFALLVLAIPLIVHANRPLSGDVFWAMAYGRVLAVTGQMPTADPFTYAPHLGDYINAQWLSQILYYLPYQLADLQGVMAFNALACTLALGLMLYAGWRHSGSLPAAAAAVLLFAFPAVWFLSARAQTLA
ncbi:MAG TPA: hypothetical protein VGL99_21620, partial [Chloroflexota bacterium]